ncbi:MAG TPA: AAA family ATPase [Candidatus Saccharimonadales bacterium]
MVATSPKLIHINGAAGIGKDTISQKYIDNHPFALCVRTDDLITTLGQWSLPENYDPARHLAFNVAISMITTHLEAGYDVIVPHLLTDLEEAEALEGVAKKFSVPFIEILLSTDKTDALERVFSRGTRGEPGAPPLTEADRPEFEELYDNVLLAVEKRPGVIKIDSVVGDIEGTYRRFEDAIRP